MRGRAQGGGWRKAERRWRQQACGRDERGCRGGCRHPGAGEVGSGCRITTGPGHRVPGYSWEALAILGVQGRGCPGKCVARTACWAGGGACTGRLLCSKCVRLRSGAEQWHRCQRWACFATARRCGCARVCSVGRECELCPGSRATQGVGVHLRKQPRIVLEGRRACGGLRAQGGPVCRLPSEVRARAHLLCQPGRASLSRGTSCALALGALGKAGLCT